MSSNRGFPPWYEERKKYCKWETGGYLKHLCVGGTDSHSHLISGITNILYPLRERVFAYQNLTHFRRQLVLGTPIFCQCLKKFNSLKYCVIQWCLHLGLYLVMAISENGMINKTNNSGVVLYPESSWSLIY